MSRRILVTGATGETGRYTTDLLISQGFEIPLCAQTPARRFGRSHSLFLPRNSLFFEIASLLICVGNCAKN
jgi:nucleoside-diphosphate-sugar epimerase